MIVSSTHLKIKHLHGNSAGCLTMSDKERLLCQQDSHFPMQCRVRKNGKQLFANWGQICPCYRLLIFNSISLVHSRWWDISAALEWGQFNFSDSFLPANSHYNIFGQKIHDKVPFGRIFRNGQNGENWSKWWKLVKMGKVG